MKLFSEPIPWQQPLITTVVSRNASQQQQTTPGSAPVIQKTKICLTETTVQGLRYYLDQFSPVLHLSTSDIWIHTAALLLSSCLHPSVLGPYKIQHAVRKRCSEQPFISDTGAVRTNAAREAGYGDIFVWENVWHDKAVDPRWAEWIRCSQVPKLKRNGGVSAVFTQKRKK